MILRDIEIDIDGLAQDCSNSIANPLETLYPMTMVACITDYAKIIKGWMEIMIL